MLSRFLSFPLFCVADWPSTLHSPSFLLTFFFSLLLSWSQHSYDDSQLSQAFRAGCDITAIHRSVWTTWPEDVLTHRAYIIKYTLFFLNFLVWWFKQYNSHCNFPCMISSIVCRCFKQIVLPTIISPFFFMSNGSRNGHHVSGVMRHRQCCLLNNEK